MKLFKDADNNIFAYEIDGSQDHLIGDKIAITQIEADRIQTKKDQSKFDELTYKEKRIIKYPSVNEQLDMLFHGGYDYWKQQIQIIKNTFPKE
jgi:hypothetical protein